MLFLNLSAYDSIILDYMQYINFSYLVLIAVFFVFVFHYIPYFVL